MVLYDFVPDLYGFQMISVRSHDLMPNNWIIQFPTTHHGFLPVDLRCRIQDGQDVEDWSAPEGAVPKSTHRESSFGTSWIRFMNLGPDFTFYVPVFHFSSIFTIKI